MTGQNINITNADIIHTKYTSKLISVPKNKKEYDCVKSADDIKCCVEEYVFLIRSMVIDDKEQSVAIFYKSFSDHVEDTKIINPINVTITPKQIVIKYNAVNVYVDRMRNKFVLDF